MARNMSTLSLSMNLLKGTKKMVGRRGIGYGAEVVDQGLLISERSNDVVEYDNIEHGERGIGLEGKKKTTRNIEECEWAPHPTSGIYFPKGHDWVLQDVPHSPAAASSPNFWIRNVDGVDHPHHVDYF